MTLFFSQTPAEIADGRASLVLPAGMHWDEDPASASVGFSHDDLIVVPALGDGGVPPVGTRLQVAGRRTMARHGASALDTEVSVTLLLPAAVEGQAEALLNQAMMRLALAMAM